MDGKDEKIKTKNNGLVTNNVIKTIEYVNYVDNITQLDLSNKKLSVLDENIELPPNIVVLKLSNNNLTEVPHKVLNLNHLKTLDLSFNLIVFFDETPSFCHHVEWLNLSNNCLEGPPYWVWSEQPNKLSYLNLSNNNKISQYFSDGYFDELLQYKTLVNEIDVHNCNLSNYVKLMTTFCNAKVVSMGCEDYSISKANIIDELPCVGLEDCCEVERMNLCNTQLYQINSNIDIYQNIIELNLEQNKISGLPNEFCNLKNLQICILSCNLILYLPDDMNKLTKLEELYLDDNVLCALPQSLNEITSLRVLDVYQNNLYDGLDNINHLEKLDYAQNYFEEPNDEEYLKKKEKLRINHQSRNNGRKPEVENSDCNSRGHSTDDEEYLSQEEECANQGVLDTRCSSPEDWDSDDYWIPHNYKPPAQPTISPWISFVKKKMAEGNFCPMDVHQVSIEDLIKYENYCNPRVIEEVEGQFDDYSGDES